jgi:hypothetical protein
MSKTDITLSDNPMATSSAKQSVDKAMEVEGMSVAPDMSSFGVASNTCIGTGTGMAAAPTSFYIVALGCLELNQTFLYNQLYLKHRDYYS